MLNSQKIITFEWQLTLNEIIEIIYFIITDIKWEDRISG